MFEDFLAMEQIAERPHMTARAARELIQNREMLTEA
jgi:hypothetical protein